MPELVVGRLQAEQTWQKRQAKNSDLGCTTSTPDLTGVGVEGLIRDAGGYDKIYGGQVTHPWDGTLTKTE